MENSRLGKLPAELRNRIWELTLQEDGRIVLWRQTDGKVRGYLQKRPSYYSHRIKLGLFKTCRAIYNESRGMFFAVNTIHFFNSHCDKGIPQEVIRDLGQQIGRSIALGKVILHKTASGLESWRKGDINIAEMTRRCILIMQENRELLKDVADAELHFHLGGGVVVEQDMRKTSHVKQLVEMMKKMIVEA